MHARPDRMRSEPAAELRNLLFPEAAHRFGHLHSGIEEFGGGVPAMFVQAVTANSIPA